MVRSVDLIIGTASTEKGSKLRLQAAHSEHVSVPFSWPWNVSTTTDCQAGKPHTATLNNRVVSETHHHHGPAPGFSCGGGPTPPWRPQRQAGPCSPRAV